MRGQWSEREARVVIEAWRRSGLSVERFAELQGLVPQRIYKWRKKFEVSAKSMMKAAPLALLPVQIAKSPKSASPHGEPITVVLRSGCVLKVGRGFDEEAFSRVLAMLEVA